MAELKNNTTARIFIVAGEASGDVLGAHLVTAMRTLNPQLHFCGFGGEQMRAAGVDTIVDAKQLAVVGAVEILKHAGAILKAAKQLKQFFYHPLQKPDLVIFIDYPGFNLWMAKHAKKSGIKVMFYVSPQIWAWRYGRIKKIKQRVDHMAVLFPFEEKIYEKENVPVTFVGHPLVDALKANLTATQIYQQFHINAQKPLIALLPGSRRQEIERLLPVMVAASEKILQKIPTAQFVLPLASNLDIASVQRHLKPHIQIIQNNTDNLLSVCHAAITTSGTVTLEVALLQVPQVIIYKMSPCSFWLATKLIKLPFIGLCNLVAETLIARELLQDAANAQNISEEICRLLQDAAYRQQVLAKTHAVKEKLGEGGDAMRAAKVALSLLATVPQ